MVAKERGPRTAEAMEWLTATLQYGPQYAFDIHDAAKEDGISFATLRLAKTALGVVSRKDPGVGGAWTWQLPDEEGESVIDEQASPQPEAYHCDHDDDEFLNDRLLRASEVARIFGVGRSRAHELMANGTLPAIRFGSSIRVRRSSLERWLREQEESGL